MKTVVPAASSSHWVSCVTGKNPPCYSRKYPGRKFVCNGSAFYANFCVINFLKDIEQLYMLVFRFLAMLPEETEEEGVELCLDSVATDLGLFQLLTYVCLLFSYKACYVPDCALLL